AVQPGVITLFATGRNIAVCPQQFAGTYVVCAHVTLDVVCVRRTHGNLVSSTYHHNVTNDGRREGQGHVEVVTNRAQTQANSKVQDAVVTEARNRNTGFGIQCSQEVTRGYHKNDFLFAVSPVGNAFAGVFTRGAVKTLTLLRTPHPQGLTGFCIDSNHVTGGTSSGVQNAIDHDRVGYAQTFRTRTKVVGFPAPYDLQILHIAGVDLIQRRIAVGVQTTIDCCPGHVVWARIRSAFVNLEILKLGNAHTSNGTIGAGQLQHIGCQVQVLVRAE